MISSVGSLFSGRILSVLVIFAMGYSCGNSVFDNSLDTKFTACSSISSMASSVFDLALKVTCSFGSSDMAPAVISSTPNGGVFSSSVNVHFVGNELATVYYTVDGSNPTVASSSYTVNPTLGYNATLSINSSLTLKYYSVDAAGNTSSVKSAVYTIESGKNHIVVSDLKTHFNDIVTNSVSDNSSVKITFSGNKAGNVEVRSGRGDLAGSALVKTESYTNGSLTTTINATSLEAGLNNIFLVYSGEDTNGYSVVEVNKDEVYPITIPSIAEGAYNTPQSISLVANEGAKVWYFSNTSLPLVNGMGNVRTTGTLYSAAVAMNNDLALKYYAVDYAGNATDIDYTSAFNYDNTGPVFFNPITTLAGARVTTSAITNDDPANIATMMSTGAGTAVATIQVNIKDADDPNTSLPESNVDWYQLEISNATCNGAVAGAGTLIGSRVTVGVPDKTYSIANANAITLNLSSLNEGLNYVCIFSADAAGTVNAQVMRFLKDSTVKTPVPVYPATGQKIKNYNIKFKWANLEPTETLNTVGSGEKSYQLQVDDDVNFGSPEVNYTKTVTIQGDSSNYFNTVSSGLVAGRNYYRVRFTDGADNISPWSSVIPFYFGKVDNDINGDGYSDVAVGAPHETVTGTFVGKVYVYLGGAAPNNTADITISGNSARSRHAFGRSVDIIEDLDGNGQSDLIVGATDDGGGTVIGGGFAYVFLNVHTKCSSTYPCNLTYANADFVINGVNTGDKMGSVVKDLGDLNGDGFSDYGVTSPESTVGSDTKAGKLFIFMGKASPNSTADYIINGLAANATLGTSLAFGGDFNKDGYHDLIVGSPTFTPTSLSSAGAAYLIMGKSSGALSINFTFLGTVSNHKLGDFVSGGSDINGDGYDDFGLSATQSGTANEGQFRLYLGGNNNAISYYPANTMPSSQTNFVPGGQNNAYFANSSSFLKNLTGSGGDFTNYSLGCSTTLDNGGNTSAGKCYIYSGSSLTLSSTLIGSAASENFGFSIRSLGDFNGDGYSDFGISDVAINQGRVRIFYGKSAVGSISGVPGDLTLTGSNSGDRFGNGISGE